MMRIITHRKISDNKLCIQYKVQFTSNNGPVRGDHNHLIGKCRETECNNCNKDMQQPKFVLCFFHKLSGYNSQFLTTQLGLN